MFGLGWLVVWCLCVCACGFNGFVVLLLCIWYSWKYAKKVCFSNILGLFGGAKRTPPHLTLPFCHYLFVFLSFWGEGVLLFAFSLWTKTVSPAILEFLCNLGSKVIFQFCFWFLFFVAVFASCFMNLKCFQCLVLFLSKNKTKLFAYLDLVFWFSFCLFVCLFVLDFWFVLVCSSRKEPPKAGHGKKQTKMHDKSRLHFSVSATVLANSFPNYFVVVWRMPFFYWNHINNRDFSTPHKTKIMTQKLVQNVASISGPGLSQYLIQVCCTTEVDQILTQELGQFKTQFLARSHSARRQTRIFNK